MTKALTSCLFGALLTTLALSQPGRADGPQGGPARPKTYVLLVGISEYADKQIKPRPRAETDIKALAKLFTDKEILGVDASGIRVLLGNPGEEKAEKATRANFLKALKWVATEAKSDDLVLFAFIGEGAPLGESGDRRCYFLSDSTFKGRDKDAVTAEEVGDALKNLKAKKFTTFLDVNFTGFESDKPIAEPNLGKSLYREFLGDDGTEDHLSLPGRVAIMATIGLQASLDLKDHGVFTKVLLEAFQGKADNQGYEADGLVTVDEVKKYMNKRLPDLVRTEAKTEKEKEQRHFIFAGQQSHYVLTRNPAAAVKAGKRLTAFEKLVTDKKLTDEKLIEEGRTYLQRMPILKKRQDLRKIYQEFADEKLTAKELSEKRDTIIEGMKLRRAEAAAYSQKVIEATEIIKGEYVKEVAPGKLIGWGIRELYKFVEEKIPEEIETKLKDVETLRPLALQALLLDARTALGKREDLDNHMDLTITLTRMMHKLDPHTHYVDPEELEAFKKEIQGNFTGIGIQIRKDTASDELLVVTPIKGSPAFKRGLQAGDIITEIIREVDSEGEPLPQKERTPTKGMSTQKAVKIILGKENTKVSLMIRREGVKEPFQVDLLRGRVEVESILGVTRKENADWDFMLDSRNKIGYIRMSSFTRGTFRDLELAIQDLRRQGMRGLVFDLRNNPGGLLDIAIKVTDLFVDDGLIVSIRPRGGQAREARFNGRHAGSLLDFPMVCLINGGSASGSEIVSAALQDHDRAKIFGERSYGKGSVQNIRDFEVIDTKTGQPREAQIKLTTATFWRPNGKNLNKASTAGKDEDVWGVTPDKVIKLTAKELGDLIEHQINSQNIEPKGKTKLKEFKDRQLDAALEYLRGQIKMASRAQ